MRVQMSRINFSIKIMRTLKYVFCIILPLYTVSVVATSDVPVQLINLEARSTPGNKAQLMLEFSGMPPDPTSFAINDPAKIVFDFPNVNSSIKRDMMRQKIVLGVMEGFNIVEAGETTRLILDVNNIVPYTIDTDRNRIIITLENDAGPIGNEITKYTISGLDFRRGEQGEGRVVIDFTDDMVPIDYKQRNNEITVEFRGATAPENLLRRYDVKDFGTNIDRIALTQKNSNIILQVFGNGTFEQIGYQMGKQYIIEVRPVSAEALEQLKIQKFQFTGEKISLNFQDIPIRAVLQLIADFTGLNIVISDTVQGNVTLRLEEIPWDQALDFILKSKGLAKRESGDVLLIAPSEELAAREQLELEAVQQVQSLEALQTEYIQVNFAKASDLVTIIKDSNNSLLSSRGQVSEDTRTNTLLVKDIPENIIAIRLLVERLDIPVRQVMIETQIVETSNTLTHALGIRFTGAATPQLGKYTLGVAPNMTLANNFAQDPTSKEIGDTSDSQNLFFDFISGALGKVALALGRLPGGTLLDMELQASETEGTSKTIARPKLLTLDQQTASIETGTEIPYVTTSQAGATPTTTFASAVLRLEVTPQITPNNKISMELDVTNDTPGPTLDNTDAPSINTTSLNTNVLVDNGETIVLGGIFKLVSNKTRNSLPYLHRIPVIGQLFSRNFGDATRTEILIFVTPRILQNIYTDE